MLWNLFKSYDRSKATGRNSSSKTEYRQFTIGTLSLALLATIGLFSFYHIRSHQLRLAALERQHTQAETIARGLEPYLISAKQLSVSAASLFAGVRNDRAQIETLLKQLLDSAPEELIYGIGVWYEPYQFDRQVQFFGPYQHRSADSNQSSVLTYEWNTPEYNYPTHHWYLAGRQGQGKPIFTKPYFDTNLVYMSVSQAMLDQQDQFIGVTTVDVVLPLVHDYIVQLNQNSTETIYITTEDGSLFVHPQQKAILDLAQKRGKNLNTLLDLPATFLTTFHQTQQRVDPVETSSEVAYTRWQVHVATEPTFLFHAVRELQYLMVAIGLILWITVGIILRMGYRYLQQFWHTQNLEKMVYFDDLTGLPSRAAFLKRLDRSLHQMRTQSNYSFALFYIDFNRFRTINSSLGHDIGNQLLIEISRRLSTCLSITNLVARLIEDDFCFWVEDMADQTAAMQVVAQIMEQFNSPFKVDNYEIFTSANIGILLSDARYQSALELLRDSHAAVQQAKQKGRGAFHFFVPELYETISKRLSLEDNLHRALERQEFTLHYQPIINLNNGDIFAFEALLRWHHPQQGLIAPDAFIPCLEETGLIIPVGSLILRLACEQLQIWQQKYSSCVMMSVNLSPLQLTDPNLLNTIDQILMQTLIIPDYLKLEITETAIMDNTEGTTNKLAQLRQRHLKLSIDDFGTGYSSLNYLKNFPVDHLKIDRTFIKDIGVNGENSEIVQAIVRLGKALGTQLICEGVETASHVRCLKQWGCDYGQGYFFSHPMNSHKATQFLLQNMSTSHSTSPLQSAH